MCRFRRTLSTKTSFVSWNTSSSLARFSSRDRPRLTGCTKDRLFHENSRTQTSDIFTIAQITGVLQVYSASLMQSFTFRLCSACTLQRHVNDAPFAGILLMGGVTAHLQIAMKAYRRELRAQQLRTKCELVRTPIKNCRDVHAVRLASQASLPAGTPTLDRSRVCGCCHACTSAGLSRSLLPLFLMLSIAVYIIASFFLTSDLDIL